MKRLVRGALLATATTALVLGSTGMSSAASQADVGAAAPVTCGEGADVTSVYPPGWHEDGSGLVSGISSRTGNGQEEVIVTIYRYVPWAPDEEVAQVKGRNDGQRLQPTVKSPPHGKYYTESSRPFGDCASQIVDL
ncbi:hypothetical protein [Streptomyces sp. BRA346]|uniref:hypothetical protein n=1 Tax=Streptomyces sp. BRA346 TaxID=2878199 RepID=UPI004062F27C